MIYKLIILLSVFTTFQYSVAQNMTNEKIETILAKVTDSVRGYPGYWEVLYKERQLLCLTDEKHNRMRIISPIIEEEALGKELLLDVLTANFHAALDVKYALSQGFLWSVYIHPLKELEDSQLESAVNQVVNAADNFGTTFSSTEMIFAGKGPKKESSKPTEGKPVMQKL